MTTKIESRLAAAESAAAKIGKDDCIWAADWTIAELRRAEELLVKSVEGILTPVERIELAGIEKRMDNPV